MLVCALPFLHSKIWYSLYFMMNSMFSMDWYQARLVQGMAFNKNQITTRKNEMDGYMCLHPQHRRKKTQWTNEMKKMNAKKKIFCENDELSLMNWWMASLYAEQVLHNIYVGIACSKLFSTNFQLFKQIHPSNMVLVRADIFEYPIIHSTWKPENMLNHTNNRTPSFFSHSLPLSLSILNY